ncbi:MAG: tRNA (adenosine(37)-N6)-threonylcarbamoyltransferase complex dimerization subunit type 1 TsaB, partial [Bacteroidetes bacterium]|nr:tRNA (adenosine(37)-N6)-threonylcarbamoyltransferase complex dimerization subunit type 1 TsaB [Bacteroidota bacterium]
MTRFLSIETSADACSVSLILPDAIRSLETGEPRSHARLLVPLIRELLDGDPTPLDGICVDHGPGSYTGLRIGVSTAKGLAWALDRPLHALSSLALLAAAALEDDPAASGPVRALIPTRGKECFTALYAWEGGLWS